MTDAFSLYGVAHELLVKSAEILATTTAGAPTNQYVAHGPPAYDCCDTLTVHAGVVAYSPLGGTPNRAPSGTGREPRLPVIPSIPLTVTVLRCSNAQPQGGLAIRLPNVLQISADSERVYEDGWTLFNGVYNHYIAGTLFASWPCRVSELSAAVPIAPEGGCLGWSVLVSVDLDGFTPA